MSVAKINSKTNIISEVSSTPRRVNSNYTRLSEKDIGINRFAAKCKTLLIEVQQRSATLQKYATDLVTMDKGLREAQRQFEIDFQNAEKDMSEQEEEYIHKLATLRQQKEQISNSLSVASQTTSTILSRIAQFSEESKNLDERHTDTQKIISAPVQQLSIERIDFDIDQEKSNISDLDYKIQIINDQIENQAEKGSSLLQTLNKEIQTQNSKRKNLEATKKACEEESQNIKNDIALSAKNFQSLSDKEIKLLGEQSLTQKKIQTLNEKVEKNDKLTVIIFQQLKPYRQNLAIFEKNLKTIKDEEQQFIDAINKKAQFEKGIKESTQRSLLRSKEIESQLVSLRATKKKLLVNHFMEEEKIEGLHNEETQALREIGDLEEEMANFQNEEDTVSTQMKSIEADYEDYQKETLNYQKKILKMQEVYKQLKDSFKSSKKTLKEYVKKLKEVENSNLQPLDSEIEKEKQLVNALLKGYRVKIDYTRDQCANLANSIKTEELKSAIGNSEMRRLNTSYRKQSQFSTNETSFSNTYESIQEERKKSTTVLNKIIAELEEKKKELENKITNSHVSIQNKTELYTKTQNELNKLEFDPNELKLNELRDKLKNRMDTAKSLIDTTTQIISKVNSSADEWKTITDPSKEISKLKTWHSVVVTFNDIVENIEMKSKILA